ncbi:MAG TPA: dTMP kinase [Ignavibacteria bacterium]|nr:dTMP kinase [Ignavibacteria bacterium]
MFITFEGIDFSGKSTQAKQLYNYLKRKKKKVIFVREPGGTKLSEKIRELLLDKKNDNMTNVSEFLLFSASRNQLTNEIIIPYLKKKYIVICDRYYDSSTAYQGYGGKIELNSLSLVNKIASSGLIPDRTFLLDISYKDTLKRKTKTGTEDRIEKRKSDYYNKVAKGYLTIAKQNRKRFRILDAMQPKEEIFIKILKDLNI